MSLRPYPLTVTVGSDRLLQEDIIEQALTR
jgi:hypothetical protein